MAVNWPVIRGETRTGLSVFWPDDGLDEGPIPMRKEVEIADDDTLGSLYESRASLRHLHGTSRKGGSDGVLPSRGRPVDCGPRLRKRVTPCLNVPIATSTGSIGSSSRSTGGCAVSRERITAPDRGIRPAASRMTCSTTASAGTRRG